MTKTIMILAIAAAFVAGSIATGTIAYAGDDDDELSQLLCDAGKVVTGLVFEDDDEITDILCAEINVSDADSDPSNEDQTLSGTGEVVLGTTAAGDGGGTVTCAAITGDASLCDGDDAVVDNDNDSSNELQTLTGTGSVDLSNGGSSVSCASITGGPGLCDGNDAVVDADSSTTNELQTLSGTGQVSLSNGGGSVSCSSITGGAGLCDGVDNAGITSFSLSQHFFADSVNGGTVTVNMGSSMADRFCALTKVQLRDVDGSTENASCEVITSGVNWFLIASSEPGDDSDAFCAARCVLFN